MLFQGETPIRCRRSFWRVYVPILVSERLFHLVIPGNSCVEFFPIADSFPQTSFVTLRNTRSNSDCMLTEQKRPFAVQPMHVRVIEGDVLLLASFAYMRIILATLAYNLKLSQQEADLSGCATAPET